MRALGTEVLSGLTRESAVRGLQQQRASDCLDGKDTRGREQEEMKVELVCQSWGS